MIQHLKACKNLTELSINQFTDQDARMLIKTCKQLKRIDLSFGTNLTVNALTYLGQHTKLVELNLSHNGRLGTVNNAASYLLATSGHMKKLILKSCCLNNDSLMWLLQSKSIEALDLSLNGDLSSDGFEGMEKNTTLKSLRLEETELFEQGLNQLAKNSSLTDLQLIDCELNDSRIFTLCKLVDSKTKSPLSASLRQLNLSRNKKFHWIGLCSLCTYMHALRKLDVSGCLLGDTTITKLFLENKTIEELNVAENCLTDFCLVNGLIKNPSIIRELDICRNDGVTVEFGVQENIIDKIQAVRVLHFSMQGCGNVRTFTRFPE